MSGDDSEFYVGQGFDRVTGADAARVVEFEAAFAGAREGTAMHGNLDAAPVRTDFPGTECHLPLNWLMLPERQFDYVVLRTPPGNGFPIHTHGYGDEIYLVLSGTGIVTLGSEQHEAGPRDIFHIAAGVPHGYSVPDDAEEELELFVVNSPAVSRTNRSRYWAAAPQPESSET